MTDIVPIRPEQLEELKDLLSVGLQVAEAIIDRVPAVQRRRAGQFLTRLVEHLNEPENDIAVRIRSDPRVARIVWDALSAAYLADFDAKVEALARVASLGVQDSAQVDEARYNVSVISSLDAIHIRLLLALESELKNDPKQYPNVASLLSVSEGVAQGLCADLLRLALVEAGGISFQGLHSQVRLSAFGQEVLRFLRDDDWRLDG